MSSNFDKYRIKKELGTLGHWTLHEAAGPRGRRVALAAMSKEHCPDEMEVRRIRHRLEALEALDDEPGVMTYLESGETFETLWYATAGLPVQPAENLLHRTEPLRPLQVLHHGTFLAQTLAACHRKGVTHGKVDLRHIFVDDKWRVYLGLFVLPGDGYPPPDDDSPRRDIRELLDALCQLAPTKDRATADPATRALHDVREFAHENPRVGADEIEARLEAEADRILSALEDRAAAGPDEPAPSDHIVTTVRPSASTAPRNPLLGIVALVLVVVLGVLVWRAFFYTPSAAELMNRAERLAATDDIARWERARRDLRRLRETYPAAPESEEAIALLDELSERISRRRRATQKYLFNTEPEPSEIREATEILARRYYEDAMRLLDEGKTGEARRRLEALVTLMPATDFGRKAAMQLETFGQKDANGDGGG
mgnify:CR=1 FL=1